MKILFKYDLDSIHNFCHEKEEHGYQNSKPKLGAPQRVTNCQHRQSQVMKCAESCVISVQ